MANKQNVDSQYVIYAPLNGTVQQLETVLDPTFLEKIVGDGIAMIQEDDEVVSLFPTKHASGLKIDAGVEVLIHTGLETVVLKGGGF
ncbi:phosphotransferase system IIA component [Cerasibacillus quisquiliarum]|uniref:PTS EIIA type-1 domain-containing protein n=1 Tax=Cerasibacillus quisquiliarum TaxID=227865 RepID=A0A511V1J2_9BACI|nr:PTS glucose transporter subunit IIA [Cerasibacillus quisquiliarum]MBB5146900.1 phosphotransferase system IIA component [Cerasibacillus quisquiliarum]GEN31778.1 hypothetical protein CQU01_20160 [Cerasibacillus quisquiliarum]